MNASFKRTEQGAQGLEPVLPSGWQNIGYYSKLRYWLPDCIAVLELHFDEVLIIPGVER